MVKVALVQPSKSIGVHPASVYSETLGLSYISSFLKGNNHKVIYADAGLHESIVDRVVQFSPDYVCVTDTKDLEETLDYISQYRARDGTAKIAIGGPGVTIETEKSLRKTNADFAVRGGGIPTIQHIIDGNLNQPGIYYISSGEVIGEGMADYNPNLWRRDTSLLADNPYGLYVFIASIGCYGECDYCNIRKFFPKIQLRSIDFIIQEMLAINEAKDAKIFNANDDNFLIHPTGLLELHEAMSVNGLDQKLNFQTRPDDILKAEQYLIKALDRIYVTKLGIESFIPSQLERWKRGITVEQNVQAIELLRRLKIAMKLNMIIGDLEVDDTTSYNEFTQTSAFFSEHPEYLLFVNPPQQRIYRYDNKREYPEFTILYTTFLYRIMEKNFLRGRLDSINAFYDGKEVPIGKKRITKKFFREVHTIIYKVWKDQMDKDKAKIEIVDLANAYSAFLNTLYD